jgi:signal transduction histidine kinase
MDAVCDDPVVRIRADKSPITRRSLMASAAGAASVSHVSRDPVLLLPVAVAAGLAVGALGLDANEPGSRIVTDLGLAWTLMAAALVTLERPRWQRASWLAVAAALAVLAADLDWASSSTLWTTGFLLEQLWVAVLACLVLTFPGLRAWSRLAQLALAAAFAVALGGQVLGALFDTDTRDVLTVVPDAGVAHAIDRGQEIAWGAVALLALFLVLRRLRALGGAGLRSQGPFLVAAASTIAVGLIWLGAVIARDSSRPILETIGRAVCLSLPIALVGGILWSRLRRAEASDLVIELRAPAAKTLRERLARALGDPALQVAYRIGDGTYVDAGGRPVALPKAGDRAVTAVTVAGDEVAALVHDRALLDEPALIESVRAAAALVLENERLAAEVRSQLAEVRASRGRIVAAADDERRRIERDLHDGAQQRLVTLSVDLGLEGARDPAASTVLARAQDQVEEAIAELRELARGIHPTLLRDEGLQAAVEALARRAPFPVALRAALRERLADPIELAAYYVVSEALTNVVKHARATEAAVLLEQSSDALQLTVRDDGVGGANIVAGAGIAGLRDRLEALDATLSIESAAGHGTTIRAEFPCAS